MHRLQNLGSILLLMIAVVGPLLVLLLSANGKSEIQVCLVFLQPASSACIPALSYGLICIQKCITYPFSVIYYQSMNSTDF